MRAVTRGRGCGMQVRGKKGEKVQKGVSEQRVFLWKISRNKKKKRGKKARSHRQTLKLPNGKKCKKKHKNRGGLLTERIQKAKETARNASAPSKCWGERNSER